MTIPRSHRAWQDNPEPPDHDEPTYRDRIMQLPRHDLEYIVIDLYETYTGDIREDIEQMVDEAEQEQLAKIATP